MNISVEQRITRANIAIMRSTSWGFLGGIIKTGNVTVESIGTAATDGINVMYDPNFVETLNDAELRFLVLHENMHKAYRHMSTWVGLRNIDAQMCNMAMDYVINGEILANKGDLDVSMPEGGLHDPKFAGMDTPTVFRHLMADPSLYRGLGNGMDGHIMDKPAPAEEQAEMDIAIRQSAGSAPANKARAIQSASVVKRNWRELLQAEWNTTVPGRDDQSWSRVNPVYLTMGIYLPGSVAVAAKHVNFCIDTSGSISQDVIGKAAATVADLCSSCPPESLNVIWWDTQAHVQPVPTEAYSSVTSILKPQGGGGTDPSCLIEHIQGDESFTIVLTDGYFYKDSAKDFPVNTVWLLIEGGTANAITTGKVLEM
jgi:predicted metal-dependent peptidase